jgi:hypothetical protein
MIIVKLSGGLGNQLFQYSFGRYLSLKYKTELKLDAQLNITASDFTPRQLGLSKYNIDLYFAEKNEIENYKFFTTGILSKIERKLIQIFPFLNKKFIIEKTFENLGENLFVDDCYYDGYWQSEKYFKSITEVLWSDFQLNSDLDNENKIIEEEILKSTSISLHIRRGDYISVNSNSKIFSICTLEYYNEAVNYFNLKLVDPVFYVFSDDIVWAKENFKGDNFKIVDINQNDPHADLYLMSICKHNIIANSSFSWWGAWLNRNVDKVVISPKKWYNDNSLNQKAVLSLIPDDWLVI